MLDAKLLEFLESKSPSESYKYSDSHGCAAAQFNQSIGREYQHNFVLNDLAKGMTFDNRLERIAREHPRTFGSLLQRARVEFAE